MMHRILYKLYRIEESIEQNGREINTKNKALAGLREEQRAHDAALETARVEQAKAKTNVMQKDKKIKKAEKALEAKVCPLGYTVPKDSLIGVRNPILWLPMLKLRIHKRN
jgi:hypothetical protein